MQRGTHIIGLIALSLACSSASAQVIFSDDFSGGGDAQWSRLDLIGGTSYSAASGRYQFQTVDLPTLPFVAAAGSAIGESITQPDLYADGSFRATVRVDNADTNALLICRGNEAGTAGYVMAINNYQDLIGIAILPDPTFSVWAPLTIDEGVDYIMEASFFGTELGLKVWAAGDPEPALPMITFSDSTWSSGLAALSVYNVPDVGSGSLSASFDDVTFTIPAPGFAALATGGLAPTIRRRR